MTYPEAIVQSAQIAADAYRYGETAQFIVLMSFVLVFATLAGFGLYVMHKSMP